MSDWMTIRIELTGRPDELLDPAPGRVLLCHPDHTFADVADAIDSAFGRWDVTPLHEFTVGDHRLLPGGDEDDPEAADSEAVTLGEADLQLGSGFLYVFDLGEGWEHSCRVEEVGVEATGLDGPAAVFGWGSIPDQYGRLTEDDDDFDEADEPAEGVISEDGDRAEPADEIDFEVVSAAVPDWSVPIPTDELAEAAARVRTEAQLGLSPVDVLLDAAGFNGSGVPVDDAQLWTCLAAAGIQPLTPRTADPSAEAVWTTMEAADWAGLIIGLVRCDVGQSAEPEALAHLIASSVDVETEPLVGEDRDAVLEALETVVGWWQALGAVDGDRRLTGLGRWGLPRALELAWAGE